MKGERKKEEDNPSFYIDVIFFENDFLKVFIRVRESINF